MAKTSLTNAEYEAHLKDLRDRLVAYLECAQGTTQTLLKDAQYVLELAGQYPDIFKHYEDVQGMVGEILARQKQGEFLVQLGGEGQSPGCLLGWLAGIFKRGNSVP